MKEFELFERTMRPLTRRSRYRLERLRTDPMAYALVVRVARLRRVSLRDLLQGTRGSGTAAQTRQLAMYLVYVLLSRPQETIGFLFGRDRTTVSHACAQMEMLRDDPLLGAEITRIEAEGWGQSRNSNEELRHVA